VLDFTAIDFETAYNSAASACSVGLAKVRNGKVVDRAGWLILPPPGHDRFSEWNTRIHGLTAEQCAQAPRWVDQLPELLEYIEGDTLAAHNAGFDMGVMSSACTASGVMVPEFDYLCSLQLARKTYQLESYRLPMAASAAGFDDFPHHDALADAEACAWIVIDAAKRHGAATLAELTSRAGTRISHLAPAVAA
jgi:DNA polymerase-3 subunit epsilon